MNNSFFTQHLKKIREAKSRATEILEITNPGHHEAETTLALAWEALFDNFCQTPDLNLPTLNTISSIIHKLTAAYTQIKSLEIKSKEFLIKEEEFKIKKDQILSSLQNPKDPSKSLPTETLHFIEQQFNLL